VARLLLQLVVCVVAIATALPLRGADTTGDIEAAVLREQNLARTHPREYAGYVEAWLSHYHGKTRALPGRPSIRTVEGKEGVRKAVEFLRVQKPLAPLKLVPELSHAARDHVVDTGRNGWMGHVGSDDSEPGDRVSRYGKWYKRVGENITYGGTDARELVIRLIIDDGIADRGHRANIFNPEFTLTGVAFGSHADYGTMCVITYAADFEAY
jgi:uncharacterized protein YkwD